MKIYHINKKIELRWAISLEQDGNNVWLNASDVSNGSTICRIMCFGMTGTVSLSKNIKNTLKSMGYDPYEHHNTYDEHGRIVITKPFIN